MKNIPKISFNSERATQINGFELIVLEELITNLKEALDHNPFQPHRLSFFIILIITEGKVNHSVDFETYDLQAGDVMVISKGQIHAFDKFSHYKGYMVLMTEEFIHQYMATSTIAKIKHLYNYFLGQEKLNNANYNQTLVRGLQAEIQGGSASLPNIIGSLLSIYLLKINDEKKRSKISISNKNIDYFNHFKGLIEKNFSKTRDAKVYASDLSISYKQLNEVCKEIVKSTAKTFIDSYVMLESKRMLVTTSFSVKEIAYAIGFDEVTNFTKFFKKHTHKTPSEFRKIAY